MTKDLRFSKPFHWDDRVLVDDPQDSRPQDWPERMREDRQAKRPLDWHVEEDGIWVPSKVKNPEFRGEWKAK